jgi:hypothetical protein
MVRAPTPAIPAPSEPPRKATARSRTLSVKSKPAFATVGPKIKAGNLPGYVVLHSNRQVAAITINADRSEKGEHIVRLILFLRGR